MVLDPKKTGKVPTRDVIKLFEPEFADVEANAKIIFNHFDNDGKGKIDWHSIPCLSEKN